MPAPTPDPQETQGEFMDRCMLENDTEDEGERRAECRTSWDESQDEEDPPGPGDGSGESASARRYRSINYSSSYTRGGSMNIKEIRQERADLMGEEQELKQSARALLNKPMDDERRNELLSQKEGRLEARGTRLGLLANDDAPWARCNEDELRQPAARDEVAANAAQARELVFDCQHMLERSEGDERQAESLRQLEVAHVALHPTRSLQPGALLRRAGEHLRVEIEADDADPGLGDRDGDAAGAGG